MRPVQLLSCSHNPDISSGPKKCTFRAGILTFLYFFFRHGVCIAFTTALVQEIHTFFNNDSMPMVLVQPICFIIFQVVNCRL